MKKLVIANWKENFNLSQVQKWLADFEVLTKGSNFGVEIIVAPSFPYLPEVFAFTQRYSWMKTASQDISHYGNDQHTGEVGAFQVADFCTYCILGHSERKEPLSVIKEKISLSLKSGLEPIVCFLEPEDAYELCDQDLILCWENPENISKDGMYNPKDAAIVEEAIQIIKQGFSERSRILYGGSVSREDAGSLGRIDQLDGILVGRASLDPKHFYEIIKEFEK